MGLDPGLSPHCGVPPALATRAAPFSFYNIGAEPVPKMTDGDNDEHSARVTSSTTELWILGSRPPLAVYGTPGTANQKPVAMVA